MTVFLAAVGCGSGVPASAPAPTAQQLLGAGIAYDPGNGSVIAFGGQQRAGRRIGPSDLTWRILRKLRCCPWKAGPLAKAIHVLQTHEIAG